MRRGRRQPPPDLTSLFDVLFIVIFAALIRAAAAQHAAEAKPPPPPPPKPLDPASLQARAGVQVAERPNVIVRVSRDGQVTEPFVTSMLAATADPQFPRYAGDLCGLVKANNAALDLPRALVIIAPAVKLADLPQALYDGLRGDVDRCLQEHRALAVIVEP